MRAELENLKNQIEESLASDSSSNSDIRVLALSGSKGPLEQYK